MLKYYVYGTGDKAEYTPTTFLLVDGRVWCENPEIGAFWHPTIKTTAELNAFLAELMNDGFCVDYKVYREHHSAYERGYVSRKSDGYMKPYKGRFGNGYKRYMPCFNTNRYCWITYFIEE